MRWLSFELASSAFSNYWPFIALKNVDSQMVQKLSTSQNVEISECFEIFDALNVWLNSNLWIRPIAFFFAKRCYKFPNSIFFHINSKRLMPSILDACFCIWFTINGKFNLYFILMFVSSQESYFLREEKQEKLNFEKAEL